MAALLKGDICALAPTASDWLFAASDQVMLEGGSRQTQGGVMSARSVFGVIFGIVRVEVYPLYFVNAQGM